MTVGIHCSDRDLDGELIHPTQQCSDICTDTINQQECPVPGGWVWGQLMWLLLILCK